MSINQNPTLLSDTSLSDLSIMDCNNKKNFCILTHSFSHWSTSDLICWRSVLFKPSIVRVIALLFDKINSWRFFKIQFMSIWNPSWREINYSTSVLIKNILHLLSYSWLKVERNSSQLNPQLFLQINKISINLILNFQLILRINIFKILYK